MRKLLLLLLILAPVLCAQSVQTLTPQQCLWRAGDNPAWAATNLDETGWTPYTGQSLDFQHARVWIRCKVDLEQLRRYAHPAVQISATAAYTLYIDGQPIASFGDLETGNSSMDRIRTWPLPPGVGRTPVILALRLAHRSVLSYGPVTLQLGSQEHLKALRDSIVLTRARDGAGMAVCYIVIAVVGLALLGLFLSDRSHTEILFLALTCLGLAALRLIVFAIRVQAGISAETSGLAFESVDMFVPITETLFFFHLARRRMPPVIVVALSIITLWAALAAFSTVAPISIAVPLEAILLGPYGYTPMLVCSIVAILGAALLAFFPLRSIPPGTRLLGALCCLWALSDAVWFGFEIPTSYPALPNLWLRWYTQLANARGLSLLAIVAALVALLLREQRRVVEERAELAGEMHAAQQVQKMLAPAALDTLAGMRVEAAFRPIREVGGDFYACRILPGSRQRILIGDVSGKGAAAAMTAAVLVGAGQRRDDDSPAVLLEHLNRVLADMRLGGFATCLCAEIAPDGSLTLANAGHLAPYRNGEELPLEPGLPLGIVPDTSYTESTLSLAANDRLTFLSDGVVEARNSSGELFGFDRTAALSTQSAESIAQAAQQFGQEDDITVLTLTVAPVASMH